MSNSQIVTLARCLLLGTSLVAAPARFAAATAAGSRRAEQALAPYRAMLGRRRVFFFPDSQLEIPLARFLSRELGAELVEIGTPYLHRGHLAAELEWLPSGTAVVEFLGEPWITLSE